MSGPPPPPPHGGVPKGSGLPPGKYDIFVIPEHSAGAGFLYLPSMQPNVNSFAAGFASALILVAVFQSMAPAFRAWWDGFQGLGNFGLSMMVIGVGFGAWSLGRIQEGGRSRRYGPSASGFNDGSTGSGGFGGTSSRAAPNSGAPPPPHGNSTPPPPPPHNDPPPQPPPQQERHKSSWEAPPPRPDPQPPPRQQPPPQTPPQTPPPKPHSRPPPTPQNESTPRHKESSWEKAREELRKKEEERRAKEAEQRRREEAARRLSELRAREAKERLEREKERERRDREAKERRERIEAEQRAKDLAEKLEHERKERERLEKEAKEAREAAEAKIAEAAKAAREAQEREAQRQREIKEAEEKRQRELKEEEERKQREAQEREEKRKKEALEREERRKRLQKQREEMRKREAEEARLREEARIKKEEERAKAEAEAEEKEKEKAQAEAYTQARKGTGYAFSSVGERTSMWPNGRPPVPKSNAGSETPKSSSPDPSQTTPRPPPSAAPSTATSTTAASDTTKKPPTPSSSSASRSNVSSNQTDESRSYRSFDKQKKPQHKKSTSSLTGSESSWAPSQTTSRTSPPPSVRGTYTTNDPDKIVISGVYLFMNQFAKTPASQLISGIGPVTDGLILRITTEGLFIDDDVRGVPQREWDVKAWTLKLTEVWCPPHCLHQAANYTPPPGAKANPLLFKMASTRTRDRGGPKALTGEEADLYLNEMLRACKDCCKLGMCDRKFKDTNIPSSTGQGGEWKAKGLHILRATVRDQEGKRYVFVVDETEAWKVPMGLQRLRRGTQVRQLGVSGLPSSEARGTLEMLGWAT